MTSIFHTLIFRKLYKHPLIQAYGYKGRGSSAQVTGWGYRASGKSALKGKDTLLFEDGFIRSMFPGFGRGMPFSLVSDTSGIYFDGRGHSDLIRFLNGESLTDSQWSKEISLEYTESALRRVRSSGVSKYNCYLDQKRSFEEGVLVVDQTAGDVAITYSGMKQGDFDLMLQNALDENPDSRVYVKTHPDHQYRKKHSCFSSKLVENKRITILPSDMPSAEAFYFCHTVYVGSSLLGMEGLIHGKKVITYGWNFYAGWGLTEDRGRAPKAPRSKPIALERLFEAAYLRYTHYFDPDTFEPCDIHRIIDHIELQWKHWSLGAGNWTTAGLSPWKRQLLPTYLGPKVTRVSHKQLRATDLSRVLTWGAKDVPKALESLPLTRMEDGFIRSNGLGAEFNFPMSWVFDDVGIYFDARSPSKLENDLNEYSFSLEELTEAEELMTFLRANKLTKYNLGIESVTLPESARGRKVILIPGQVDSDASIKYGSPKLSNNRELLAEVRRQNPDAFICYKPHPDLLAGARRDSPLWEGIEGDVDHLVLEGDIISWIQAVDEVHTLTSTVGFEALLHHKPVYTYGLPFYAGWGLTHDWLTCERRRSKRSLSELTCAVLILYPTYVNPKTKEFTSAMNAARILTDPNFKHDSRSGFLRLVGKAKSFYYKLVRRL